MRILLSFTIHPDKGDALIKEGRIGETMATILEELKPWRPYSKSFSPKRRTSQL